MRLVFALTTVVALSACGSKPKAPPAPPTAASAPVAAAPAALAAPKPDEKPAAPVDEWSYSSAGKRDPFRSYLAELDAPADGLVSRCATPLGRFDVEQLKLVAVVTGLEDPVAMVEVPTGIGYSLRRGACVGKNGGVISAVRTGEVVVSEWAIRKDGTREKAQTVIRLPKEASLTIQE
jgi:type IV pilus assembly protein PilP